MVLAIVALLAQVRAEVLVYLGGPDILLIGVSAPLRYARSSFAVAHGKELYVLNCRLDLRRLPEGSSNQIGFTVFLDTPVIQSIRFRRNMGNLEMRLFQPVPDGPSIGGLYQGWDTGDEFSLRVEMEPNSHRWRIFIDGNLIHDGPFWPSSGDLTRLRFSMGNSGSIDPMVGTYSAKISGLLLTGFNPPSGGESIIPTTTDYFAGEPLELGPRTQIIGDDLVYQWTRDGQTIVGAETATLRVEKLRTEDAGTYVLTVSNPVESIEFTTEILVKEITRLRNLSTRASVAQGDQNMIIGFVTRHRGSREYILRAAGPALSKFGVPQVVADPKLSVANQGVLVAENSDWEASSSNLDGTEFSRVGAFAFDEGSGDSALRLGVPEGVYTLAIENEDSESGVALGEIYELFDDGGRSGGLANLSTRVNLAESGDKVVMGFVVDGTAPQRFLIRAVGPSLSAYGVSAPLRDPQLILFDHRGQEIARNHFWSTEVGADSAARLVGAFELQEGSADAVIVTNLSGGVYTVEISSLAQGSRGTVLGEIYLVPELSGE